MDAEMKFAWIPPGRFDMGPSCGADKSAGFRVTISKGFWMGTTPVTQAQFQAVMGYNPSFYQGPEYQGSDQFPVESVSWFDCEEFCKVLDGMTGKAIRLPTEAEWEYACRAGTSSEFWNGNGEDALKKVAWYHGNSGDKPKPVATRTSPLHPWGLHDVHGNVWEWCKDFYGSYPAGDQTDPQGPSTGEQKLTRGGAYEYPPDACRATHRNCYDPKPRSKHIGFRVCFRID